MKENPNNKSYPLSPLQQGMLFHYLFDQHSGVDIEQMVCALHENLQVQVFEMAWQQVVKLHSTLRTSFHWKGDKEPIQEVHEHVVVPFVLHDWRELSESERRIKLKGFLKSDRQLGFDLTKAPLIRLTLFQAGDAHYQLVWTFHHSIADGRSHQIILKDLFAIYSAACLNKNLHLKPPPLYYNYINWFKQQDFSKSKNYWQKILRGFTTATPLVINQINRMENINETGHPEQEICLTEDVTSSLRIIGQENQFTLNTLVQGSWAVLLSRISGEDDVCFGATRACRYSTVDGAENVVGLFINTLPVRMHVSPNDNLISWLKEFRAQQVIVRKHEHTPLVQVKAWSDVTRGAPLFDSIVVFDNYYLNTKMQSLGPDWINREFYLLEQTGFLLSLYAYGESELRLKLIYDPNQFDSTTIRRMLGHLKTLLEEMVVNPNCRLSELPILTEEERQKMLVDWNITQKDVSEETCIHQLVETQVERTPNAPAVVFGDQQLSYNELNSRANQLANHLRRLGVGPEVLVGIHMDRSLDMIVGLLGILKAGGAYVPLDPTYPGERLSFILNDSKAKVLLTEEKLNGRLSNHQTKVFCLDSQWELISHESRANPDLNVKGENLAYVIYTSGSTGQPKGVMVEHRNVINFFAGMDADINHEPPGVWLAATSISFDISVLELFWTITRGFKVVLFDLTNVMSGQTSLKNAGEKCSPSVSMQSHNGSLSTLIRQHVITHMQCTPSLIKMIMLSEDPQQSLGMIKNVMIGGEAFPVSLAKQLENIVQGKLLNMYGPTETTIWSSTEHVENVENTVSIGRPIVNTEFYVLDRNMQPIPVGVPGELFIGGKGVVRGYLNRPKLTEEKFIPNPFNNGSNGCLYRTGDLVRYMSNGKVDFLGRLDHQVKIRGHRIELGEIETILDQYPAVREAAVIIREDTSGDKQLVAYLTTESDSVPLTNEIRSFLKEKLPDHMVPSLFVFLAELPLTPNGKVNHRALPKPESARIGSENHYEVPRSITEKEVAKLWTQVLGIENIGLNDNFFDLGGHSLSTVQMINRIQQAFDVNMSIELFSSASTLSDLAQKVDLAKVEKTLKNLSFPTRFAVEVCADCNLACTMCYHPKMRRPKGRMPFELWKKCADQIAEISPNTQCWFSFCGDPLLEPQLLLRIIKYGKSVGLRSLNINTNGMLLTPDLAEPILDSGIDLVVFGIDGFTKETYERIRVNGKRDELYANVEHFLAARQARSKGPDVQVQFIEMDENKHELENFKKYWLERGAIVKFRRMLSWGGKFEPSFCIPDEERIPCPWSLTMMHVFWDGRIPRCPGDTEGEEGAGNAWDEPLIDLWRQLGVNREKHLKHRFNELPERCHTCTDWMTGSAERIDPNKDPSKVVSVTTENEI